MQDLYTMYTPAEVTQLGAHEPRKQPMSDAKLEWMMCSTKLEMCAAILDSLDSQLKELKETVYGDRRGTVSDARKGVSSASGCLYELYQFAVKCFNEED